MPIRKDFKTGEFCWIDLAAHDLKAAAAWYGELFGWKAVNLTKGGPPYEFFMHGEAAAAAVGQMSDEMKAQGIPPHWNSYVCVESCEASEKRARELGATVVVPTMDVPGHGKLCFFLDPEGASIAMWQQLGAGQGPVFVNPFGHQCMGLDVAVVPQRRGNEWQVVR